MLAVFDFIPHFCANCGNGLALDKLNYPNNVRDYLAFASFSCKNCKMRFQNTATNAILKAADEVGGDMRTYYERGE